jgi:hypothetical protein
VHEFESVPCRDIHLGQFLAPLLDHHRRLLEELGEQVGGNRVVGDQPDRLDRPLVFSDSLVHQHTMIRAQPS